MILGIIIGVFIGGCVAVVVMAILRMAKEDNSDNMTDTSEDDGSRPVFPCPQCGKGRGTIGYDGAFLFCPECGYRTRECESRRIATKEWNEASTIRKNNSNIPSSCYVCLTTTSYGRVLKCPAYKKLKEDPLSIDWVNGIYRGTKRVKGKTDCPLDKEDKADDDKTDRSC